MTRVRTVQVPAGALRIDHLPVIDGRVRRLLSVDHLQGRVWLRWVDGDQFADVELHPHDAVHVMRRADWTAHRRRWVDAGALQSSHDADQEARDTTAAAWWFAAAYPADVYAGLAAGAAACVPLAARLVWRARARREAAFRAQVAASCYCGCDQATHKDDWWGAMHWRPTPQEVRRP